MEIIKSLLRYKYYFYTKKLKRRKCAVGSPEEDSRRKIWIRFSKICRRKNYDFHRKRDFYQCQFIKFGKKV